MTLIGHNEPILDDLENSALLDRPGTSSGKLTVRCAWAAVLLIVLMCTAAPLYAHFVAHAGPDDGSLSGTLTVGDRTIAIVSSSDTTTSADGQTEISAGGQPIGPQWLRADGRYVLGADTQGRDIAVRLLYGGRLSLVIGAVASVSCIAAAVALALTAGYLGGWVDAVVGRALDVIWSFPWILLSLALGTAIAVGGFDHFGLTVQAGHPVVIIALLTYAPIPYYARALRARVLTMRDMEFVRAAKLSGAGLRRILLGEILPNISSLVPAMLALDFANVLLAESTLTFLGVGVQPPTSSWGSMIAEGQPIISTTPLLTVLPALGILAAALSLNVIGESVHGARRRPGVRRRFERAAR